MERVEFEALVERMERFATERPAAYTRHVLAWGALGYAFLFAVLVVLFVLAGLALLGLATLKAFAVKLLVVLVPAIWVIARSLWVRFTEPEGIRLSRADSPALFELVDGLRCDLRTPRVHAIVLTQELNAAVTQVPRLGFLGGYRNILVIGLPLMKSLTVEQMRAVLAHELGHLSRGHARVGNWIYRLRLIWERLGQEFDRKERAGATVIRRFFAWYVPRFTARSFPLARRNEYEADAASARMTSPDIAAEALTGVNVMSCFLSQSYWPAIHGAARELPVPTAAPYSAFRASAALAESAETRQVWLDDVLRETTSLADTHPCLSDRLQAIGSLPRFAPPAVGESADSLLGSAAARLVEGFDAEWRERIAGSWREYHERVATGRARLSVLAAAGDASTLGEEDLLERAALEEAYGAGAEAALPLRRSAFERFPASNRARFALGRQLLERRDAEGAPLVEAVMRADPDFEVAALELLRDFTATTGDRDAAAAWHARLEEALQRDAESDRERSEVRVDDDFRPHGLSSDVLAELVAALRSVPGLRRAWLVRKQTAHYQHVPLYVIGFRAGTLLPWGNAARARQVMKALKEDVTFPGETLIINVAKPNHLFKKRLGRVPGSRVV